MSLQRDLLLLLGNSAPFTPNHASVPLAAWYETQDLSLAEGATPSSLPDKSGNGRHITTFSNIAFRRLGANGFGAIRTTGTSTSYLRTPSFALPQPFTVFLCGKINRYTLNARLLDGATAGEALISQSPSPDYILFAGSLSTQSHLGSPASGLTIVRAVFNGASSNLTINNGATATGSPGSLGTTDGFTFGNGGGSGTFPADLDFAVALIYAGVTSAADNIAITAYIRSRLLMADAANYVVFDGDSITYGLNLNRGEDYPSVALAALGSAWERVNLGIAGQTQATMLSRAAAAVTPYFGAGSGKNVSVLLGGINDLAAGVSAATIYANHLTYLAARKSTGFQTAESTILKATILTGPQETARQALNVLIRGDATKYDVLFDFDADPRLQDPTNLTYFQPDGTHPTAAGAAVMGGIAAPGFLTL